jgi:hypothetical protein
LVYYEKLVALYNKAKKEYDKSPNERAAHSMSSIEEFAVSWTNPDALSFLDKPTLFFSRFLNAIIGALKSM